MSHAQQRLHSRSGPVGWWAGLHLHPFPTNFGQSACNSVKVQPISSIMPDRPPNCRTAEIACTISEMYALSPKLAGKKVYLTPQQERTQDFLKGGGGGEQKFSLIGTSRVPKINGSSLPCCRFPRSSHIAKALEHMLQSCKSRT